MLKPEESVLDTIDGYYAVQFFSTYVFQEY